MKVYGVEVLHWTRYCFDKSLHIVVVYLGVINLYLTVIDCDCSLATFVDCEPIASQSRSILLSDPYYACTSGISLKKGNRLLCSSVDQVALITLSLNRAVDKLNIEGLVNR